MGPIVSPVEVYGAGLEEAFDIELGLTMLGGDQESRLYDMRDFSHLSLALKYSF